MYNDRLTNGIAIATQKKSEIGSRLSAFLLHLNENGESKLIMDKWGIPQTCLVYKRVKKVTNFHRYPLRYGLSLALILGGTAIACVFILLVENWCTRLREKRRAKYNVSGKEKVRSLTHMYHNSEPR